MIEHPSTGHYVVVCGPLASGKTALTQILADNLGWRPIFEDLDGHPYFHDFYRSMTRWGFHTAAFFLIRALELQSEIRATLPATSVCQDWYVAEHHEVYNRHMLQEGILTERDYATCQRLHRLLMAQAIAPDLIIHLKADYSSILSRVARRHRQVEVDGLSAGYLENLIDRYETWMKTVTRPVLQIDTAIHDFVKEKHSRNLILELVEYRLGCRRGRPSPVEGVTVRVGET